MPTNQFVRACNKGVGIAASESKRTSQRYFQGRKYCHFMDTKAPGKEVSQELTRESLIAISQSIPDKVLALEFSSELNSTNVVELKDSDGAEKYRSKLISISDTQSPDTKPSPVALGNLED